MKILRVTSVVVSSSRGHGIPERLSRFSRQYRARTCSRYTGPVASFICHGYLFFCPQEEINHLFLVDSIFFLKKKTRLTVRLTVYYVFHYHTLSTCILSLYTTHLSPRLASAADITIILATGTCYLHVYFLYISRIFLLPL